MLANDDKKKFSVYMALLGTAFGDKGISPERIDVYYEHLRDIPVDLLGRAVQTILKTRKFSSVPTIAEIREAAFGREDEIEAAAVKAWGEACHSVERGQYLADSIVGEAVRVSFGGWEQFGQTDPENGVADRAHFIRVFKSLAHTRRDGGGLALGARVGGVVRELSAHMGEKEGLR